MLKVKNNRLELLRVELLEDEKQMVGEIDRLRKALWRELGWHYLLDLIWILKKVEEVGLHNGATILDAGGGKGILQLLLADRGFNIISVDYSPRNIQLPFKLLYNFEMKENVQEIAEDRYYDHIRSRGTISKIWSRFQKRDFSLMHWLILFIKRIIGIRKPGRITIYQANMLDMNGLDDNSVDAVVSLSAIEHMDRSEIPRAVDEFERKLKPEGAIILTTSAARDEDWYHEPAKAWCFSASTLVEIARLPSELAFSSDDYDQAMAGVRGSQELKDRLAGVYFTSDQNGMPWGVWNPTYLPVGVMRRRSDNL